MASSDILCFNPFNLKNKIMKIEHKKILPGPSKILKNISWPINNQYMPKIFHGRHKKHPAIPSYILNVQSLSLMFAKVVEFLKNSTIQLGLDAFSCFPA